MTGQYDADGFLQTSYDDGQYWDTYENDNAQYDASQYDESQYYTNNDFDDVDTEQTRSTYTRPRPQNRSAGFTRPRPQQHQQSSQAQQITNARPKPQPAPSGGDSNVSDYTSEIGNMVGMTSSQKFLMKGLLSQVERGIPIRNIPSSLLSFDYYKYWFRVDSIYVLKKLRLLIFPFLNKNWERAPDPVNEVYPYLPPRNDLNAPDLYIPLMSIVTYMVIMGFVVGLKPGSSFSPQVLLATGSSAFGMLTLEVMLMKFGFYLVGSIAQPPFWLDLVCYAGYKLAFVVMNLTFFLFIDSLTFYYVLSVSTGLISAFYMVRTLGFYFKDFNDGSGFIQSAKSGNAQNIFLLCVAGIQILFVQIMGRYAA